MAQVLAITPQKLSKEKESLVAGDGSVLDGAVVSGVTWALHQEGDNLHLLLVVEGDLQTKNEGPYV
jgi:hypothetical protein